MAIKEKGTGEMYASKMAMAKHEKGESKAQKMKEKHPGFKAVAVSISKKQGIPVKNAKAIVAATSRKASAKAKAANPMLKKVMGKMMKKK
jgi:hypothetical protein